MIFATLIITLIILIYYKLVKPHNYWKQKGVPYIPSTLIVGNLGRNTFQRENFIDSLQSIYEAKENKRYVGAYMFLQPVLMLRDVELIKRIMVREFETFPDHKPLASPDIDPIGGKVIMSLPYEKGWHDLRATLSPSFTSSKMRKMYVWMDEVADQLVNYLSNQDFQTVDMKNIFSRVAIDVIASTAFGLNCNSLANPDHEFCVKGKSISDFSGLKILKFMLCTTTLGKLLKISFFNREDSEFFRNIVSQTISHREKENITRYDMLHLLLQARNKGRIEEDKDAHVEIDSSFALVEESKYGKTDKKIKVNLDDDTITAQVLAFILAGFAGVSDSMAFVLYDLASNPTIQNRLYNEIKDTVGEKGKIAYDQLLKMKYLDCVLSESLRLRPVAYMLDRLSVRPYTIEPELPGETPVHLPVGSIVWIPVWAIHRDPKHYPNPEKFDPERFSDENKHNIHSCSYLPFGLGPRNCIGIRFALIEMKLMVARMVQHFEVVPVGKTTIPFKLDSSGGMAMPKEGLWLGLKKRGS